MHKMAFHRARVLSVIECAASAPLKRGDQSETAESVKLADNIAPPLRPSRAEVFLPYSLPGKGTDILMSTHPLTTCHLVKMQKGDAFYQFENPVSKKDFALVRL